MKDENYMQRALNLAEKGCGRTNPNPMVGAVVVLGGQIIGEGYHEGYGLPHAERNALASCAQPPGGAELYVTLEPCCHYGKTPPCTEAIIESGIRRVVIGSSDPNPLVAGKGVEILRSHGVEVVIGVLQQECDKQNQVFFHYIKTGTPFVVLKYAMTADGKIATRTGLSRWITGEQARKRVHEDRCRYAAIMVGAGTVLTDDPQLICRLADSRQPLRIICDTHLRTPVNAQVSNARGQSRTLFATCCQDKKQQQPFLDAGCEMILLPEDNGRPDLNELMKELGRREIDSVLLEGGSSLSWSALQSGIVNKLQIYIAPKIFGGDAAKSPVGGLGAESPDAAFRLSGFAVTPLGEDLLLESEVLPCSPEL